MLETLVVEFDVLENCALTSISRALPVILTIFPLAGLMQIGLGALGLGKYIKYIPNSVVSGFMTAIAVIILVNQIMSAVGYPPKVSAELVN
ncbi:MAG: SulP family sulfate permease [Bacteroidia bacterium]|jgi:SulP family sulfate permease